MEVVGQRHTPAVLPQGKRHVTRFIREAGWAPGPVWTDSENLAPIRIRSPDLLPSSESLCLLSYTGPLVTALISLLSIK
jgi:hypothetical protein